MNAAIENDPKSVELGNPKAMYKALSSKAEKYELEKINEQKTNRSELNTFVDRLSIMQKEVTHLLVLFNESLKLNLHTNMEALMKTKETKTYELIN
jgi:hypothetical protein